MTQWLDIKYMGRWAYRNPFWSINVDLTYAYYRMFDPFLFFYFLYLRVVIRLSLCLLPVSQCRIEQINRRFYRFRCDLFVVMTRVSLGNFRY